MSWERKCFPKLLIFFTKQELFAQAKFNAKMFQPSMVIPMGEIVKGEDYGKDGEEIPMYIVTNQDKSFGAYGMMDTDLLSQLEEKWGDLYILPSSVHETIVMPVKETHDDYKFLEMMVKDINRHHVAPWEVLSDHVYTFREGKVRIIENGKELTHEQYQKEQNKTKSGPQLS